MLTVVHARMTSRRLPGKALIRVGDKTILEWVLHRLRLAGIDDPIVATSTDPSDDPIENLCNQIGVAYFRGSLDDVLDRTYRAAHYYNRETDAVIRITADCPLLDPDLLKRTIAKYRQGGYDYVVTAGASPGFGQEIISMAALEQSWRQATDPFDREHVVTWWLHNGRKTGFVDGFDLESSHRFTLDTPNDLARLQQLYAASNGTLFDLSGKEIIRLCHHRASAAPH